MVRSSELEHVSILPYIYGPKVSTMHRFVQCATLGGARLSVVRDFR